MNEKQKQLLGWVIVAIAVVVAGFLGVTYPMPAPPSIDMGDISQQSVGRANYEIPTYAPTDEPGVVINNKSAGAVGLQVELNATPVWQVNRDGSSSAQDFTVVDDLVVGDTLDVNGNIDLDGDGFDVDITAGASIDTDGATNLSASTGDITFDAEAGTVNIIGSEAAADSVTIDANDTVTSGLNIDVGSVSGLTIDGGLTNIGSGSPALATGDNDLYVTADLEVDGLFSPGFANLALTDGDFITPTVTVYALDTSGAVTVTLAATGQEGQILILINDDANATIINDTNIRTSDGNAITLAGAYDVVMFVFQDSEWLELLAIANS